MKFLGRIILVLAISLAGIYCLPNGPEKLQYIMFRIFPNMPTKETVVGQAPVEETDYEEVEESENDTDSSESVEEGVTVTTPVQTLMPTRVANTKLVRNRNAVHRVVGKNYLDAVVSSGKLERWNPRSFPLKVYIEQRPGIPPEYIEEVKNAFSTWQNGTRGFVSFVYTSSPTDADYKCIFSDLKNRNCDEKGAGVAAYQYFTYNQDGNIQYSVVTLSPYTCSGQKWPRDYFYSTALHEIGHGLGLKGHSTDTEDLMYPVGLSAERSKISEADMNTLRAIYSIIPDVTDAPFTEEDKKGLITSADFWGESDSQRAEFTIQQLQENIRITPDNPNLYIALAEAYKKKGSYNLAVQAYSESLKRIDNPETASGVLFEAASMYIELGKLDSADKCLNKILTYGKKREVTDFYNYIAVKYAKDREYKLAERYFDKALFTAVDEGQKTMIYKNYRWLGYVQKDKVMFNKYNKLLGGK